MKNIYCLNLDNGHAEFLANNKKDAIFKARCAASFFGCNGTIYCNTKPIGRVEFPCWLRYTKLSERSYKDSTFHNFN